MIRCRGCQLPLLAPGVTSTDPAAVPRYTRGVCQHCYDRRRHRRHRLDPVMELYYRTPLVSS